MWCKALIVFAAVSAAIAAVANDDLSAKVSKKLDEYKGLYKDLANQSYNAIQISFQETKLSNAELIDGIQGNFSYDDAAKNVSDLEAKAKELGKNISACLSRYNLVLLQTQQINSTLKVIDQVYSESTNNIQVLLNATLHSTELKQKQEASKFDSDIKECLGFADELTKNACLWETLTKIEIDIIEFQSEASLLSSNLVFETIDMQNRISDAATQRFANWEGIVNVFVVDLFSCANVFTNLNHTADGIGQN